MPKFAGADRAIRGIKFLLQSTTDIINKENRSEYHSANSRRDFFKIKQQHQMLTQDESTCALTFPRKRS